jgi:tetratricopeptide (TPR) repeat protein
MLDRDEAPTCAVRRANQEGRTVNRSIARSPLRRLALALAAAGVLLAGLAFVDRQGLGTTARSSADPTFDPLLDSGGAPTCGPLGSIAGQPRLLLAAVTKTETLPFQPQPMQAAGGEVPIYRDLGSLAFRITTKSPRAQTYFNQGLRLSFAFNHAEAQRAFQTAQKADPDCAACFWGEALILGPNINVPMAPDANAPALAALAKAVALKDKASAKERALIEALEKRYSADPKAERPALDGAYADAMKAVAARYPADDTLRTLYVEAAMDTQPWDYWQPGGVEPKGRGGEIIANLETVLKRNPNHPGAIHLYIHAVEASTTPERALAGAERLGALMPGAGHIVHMPAHIYYRVGQYRRSLDTNKLAVRVDEKYFAGSPSDPLYKSAYYPHNIHFVMVSAQMGGDGATAIDAAKKLDAAVPAELAKQFQIMEPVKAAPYTTQLTFADPDVVLALAKPDEQLVLVRAMYHYARAIALARKNDLAAARAETDAIAALDAKADYKPYEPWGVPAKAIVQTARMVATGRIADAAGDLDGAAKAYREAVALQDSLSYTEPPYWYYPIRQSLGGVLLRQGKLDEAEQAFRDSLARVRNNGWALAGLTEVYRKKGDKNGEAAAQRAYAKAWFGPSQGPNLARL